MSPASWWRPLPRRGVLADQPPALPQVATGRAVARVWLALAYLVTAGWLVIAGRMIPSVSWAEGAIAPRSVYAPMAYSYMVEMPEPNGRASVQTIAVQRGELLVAKGQRLTADQTAALRAITARAGQPLHAPDVWGLGVLTGLLGVMGMLFVRVVSPATVARTRPMMLVGLLSLGTLGMALAIVRSSWPIWGLPMAAMGMMLTLLVNPSVALITTMVTALLTGLLAGQRLAVALGVFCGGAMGVFAVRGARRREHLLAAGVWSGIAQGVAVTAVGFVEHLSVHEALWEGAAGGFWSGAAAFVLTIALLPVLEKSFGVITDITLLELSDLNHPLLKELSLRAPGTYHHSLIVATLAEAGCEAIQANGLLARVGCYFHDIGKMPKAEYFVENQRAGRSQHDALSPSMSSLIIINHVKEGVELAKAHHLNQAIIDFIPGHHGTGIIYYFYRRALEQVEDESLLNEESFRYPGPRPCTRETAVAMLADSSEAACRAVPDHSPAKLTGVVRRIINNKFIDGQLNDSELTLKDLERIAEAFVRVLTGMYHNRVPYPMPPGEDVEDSELHADSSPESADDPGAPPRPPARRRTGPASA